MNIWDFGGQDIYHATHRFFLTRRSLYVLLTETRRQDDNFDYWIPNIRLFGENSPVIVAKNLFKGHQRQVSIARFRQSESFNIVENILDVNLDSNEGLDYLEKVIRHQASCLPHIGDPVPKTWVQVREQLKSRASEAAYISYDSFWNICKEQGIQKQKIADTLGGYLHDLGIVLWYEDIDALKDKFILQPEWATRAVYLIIDDEKFQGNEGNFDQEDIRRLWSATQYLRMHKELLALMKAFRLCFQKKNLKEYLIPALLPPEPKETLSWDNERNLRLQYNYSFMPKGIVNQLTAELYRYIKSEGLVWGRGIWLEDSGTEALIVEDWIHRKIDIRVKGINPSGMMGMLVKEMNDIHDTYPGISLTKKVPCICSLCKDNPEPELYEYPKLVEKLSKHKSQYYCNKGEEFVDIKELLFRVGMNTKEFMHPQQETRHSIKGDLVEALEEFHQGRPDPTFIIENKPVFSNVVEPKVTVPETHGNNEPIKDEPKVWHQQWWFGRLMGALVAGVLAGILTWRFSDWHFFDGLLIGFSGVAAFLFAKGNPKRRFYRAAMLCLAAATSSLLLNFQGSFSIDEQTEKGGFKLLLEYLAEYEYIIVPGLLLLAGYLYYLDSKKD